MLKTPGLAFELLIVTQMFKELQLLEEIIIGTLQHMAHGKLQKKIGVEMTKDTGSISTGSSYWPGVGWTGQPLIIHWDEDVRRLMNINSELKIQIL